MRHDTKMRHPSPAWLNAPPINDEAAILMRRAAKAACEALLRAHLTTGKHWLTTREQFDAACEIAGLR